MVRIAPRARPWFRRALPMISIIDIVRVRGPLTIFDLGPVHDLLPWGSLVSFKVASWSMFPTIHKGDLFFGRLQARIVAEGLGLWRQLKRRSIIQRLAAYMLRKSVKFSAVREPDPLGAPGSLSSWHVSASLR